MARRVQLPESKLRRKRRIMRTRLAIVLGVLAVVLFGVVVGLSWLPYIRIHAITVSGQTTLSEDTLRSFTADKISGRSLFIFPKNNILSYAREDIRKKILAEFPQVRQVSIRAKNPQTVEVSVTERTPQSLWCDILPTNNPCLLMDGNGFAYVPEAGSSTAALIRYTGNASTTPGYTAAVVPRQFLTPEQFIPLQALVSAISENQKDNPVLEVAVDEHGDVAARFANNFILKFVLAEAGKDVYQRYTIALSSAPFVGKSTGDFEYLDLRFGDKLYFKERVLGEVQE